MGKKERLWNKVHTASFQEKKDKTLTWRKSMAIALELARAS